MTPTTIITAFFDIHRAEKGDGRTLDEYFQWGKKTLQLNCQLFVVTEPKFESFFRENRPPNLPMTLKIMDFKDCHYYRYYDKMKQITSSSYYKNKVAHPNRVECILPEYNIIQYSKFHFLQIAIEENPYQSSHFLWMDLGASRFFEGLNLSKPYPSLKGQSILDNTKHQFFAQCRYDLLHYPIDDNFIWKADNLIYGGTFGGSAEIILTISKHIEHIFVSEMLEKQNVNNEQLALALLWKKYPERFHLITGSKCLETFHYFT